MMGGELPYWLPHFHTQCQQLDQAALLSQLQLNNANVNIAGTEQLPLGRSWPGLQVASTGENGEQ